MSSYTSTNQLPPMLGSSGASGGGGLPPMLGQRNSGLDAPQLPPMDLTGTTKFHSGQDSFQTLADQALGRASMILDQVRNRKMSWQDAQNVLKTLSAKDKDTLVKFRPDMNTDEKRALGLEKGGGGGFFHSVASTLTSGLEKSLILGPELIGSAIGGHNAVSDTAGNFTTDVGQTVRSAPAGIAKIAVAGAEDFASGITNPMHPSSHLLDQVIKPMGESYWHTYGPALPFTKGTIGTTADRIQDHPLGPLLDAFAVASAGIGTAGRAAAASKAMDATKVTEAADGTTRIGVGAVDLSPKTYAPLGYDMKHYLRPTPAQIAEEPYLNHFSVLIDAKTGESIFSPVGSSHDEIYDPLFGGVGTATRERWDNPTQHPVIQATGVFDPDTGKVGAININPDDLPIAMSNKNVGKLVDKVKTDAEKTYITADQWKAGQKTNQAGTFIIAGSKTKEAGEPQMWYIRKPNGQRVASNFPDKPSAIAHAQSLITGGILPNALENTWREWYQPARYEKGAIKALGQESTLTPVDLASDDVNRIAQETHDWPEIQKGVGPPPREMAYDIMDMAHDGQTEVYALRSPEGRLEAVVGHGQPETMPFTEQPYVHVAGVASATPGAGIRAVAEVAKKFPGHDLIFESASPELKTYYERMGAKTVGEGDEYGYTHPMVLKAEDAAKLAEGKPVVTGTMRQQRVRGAGVTPKSQFQIGKEAFLQRPRGSLIDAYEKARNISHTDEYEKIIEEVVTNVLDNEDLHLGGRTAGEALKDTFHQIAEDLTTTYHKDVNAVKGSVADRPEFMSTGGAVIGKALLVSLREASDMVRAGAVFLRPAYIPNNWAGNGFLNAIHQGVFAPVNLAKALVIDKHIGVRYTRAIDQSMGFNAAQLAGGGRGAGYVASAVDPVAQLMGRIGDQPFRRAAWIHEARRSGYKTMGDILRLLEQADKEKGIFNTRGGVEDASAWDPATTPALHEVAKIARASQEEIIKFGKYNDIESGILRNLIFVYSWMRGAGRYFGRFPMQHPIQAALSTSVAGIGQNWLNQSMGGVPSFLVGAIPVGKDKNGNTILINPFSVNPLGSGLQMLNAALSVNKIVRNPSEFNKYVDQDPAQLLNPLLASGIEAYTGGRPMTKSLPDTIAGVRLYENLKHPGRGQIYPTSRVEALGQFGVGTMFPRKSSQQAITRSLERERQDQPEQRIDDELKLIKDKLGIDMPPQMVKAYREDLTKVKQQKDFQHAYAEDHGSQGFTNMPAANQAEAAIEYLTNNGLANAAQLEQYQQMIDSAPNDEMMKEIANNLWSFTGAGSIQRQWQAIVSTARKQELTKKRP